jgi:TonB-dependent starch-binding outer membrane protein SusC
MQKLIKKKRLFLTLFFCLFLLSGMSFSSEIKDNYITGTVYDAETGESLVGVNIIIKGSFSGTVSDRDGNFRLIVNEDVVTILISYIGYLTEELEVRAGSELNIQLVPGLEELQEIVVIGYGTQKERNITGSVAHMRAGDIREMAVTSLDQTMQGRLAGVVITQNSSAPGGSVTVRVRGATSGTSNEPLYVIDGIPIYNDNTLSAVISPGGGGQPQNILASLNPSDIENITVLKDASATSIYGSRGANGVVIIQTRRGKAGETSVNFETYQGMQQISRRYDLLNAREFAELSREAALNSGLRVYLGDEPYFNEVPPFIDPGVVERQLGSGTDWQGLLLQNAPVRNYQLSVTSGSEKGNYSFMAGYYDQEGIIRGSDFNRYSMRFNTNYSVSPRILFGSSVAITRNNSNLVPTDGAEATGAVIAPALSYLPVVNPRRDDGSLTVGVPGYFGALRNPLIPLEFNEMTTNSNRVIGNVFTDLTILNNLIYKFNLGFDYNNNEGSLFAPTYTRDGFDLETTYRSRLNNRENMWLLENTLNYNTQLASSHNLELLAGYSAQEFHREWTYLLKRGFSNIANTTFQNARDVDGTTSGSFSEYALISMFGRVNYNFREKYLASFTLRRDGSSRFGRNNRYGTFPAFSLGWRLSDETFAENYLWLSNFMLRYSYGISGNQEIGNYAFLAQPATPEVAYAFSRDTPRMGTWPHSLPNESLAWEETAQGNIGTDISLMNNRIELNFDYYRKVTSGVLVYLRPPVLAGFSGSHWENAGTVENKGFEALISGRILSRVNFRWLADFNFSVNKNSIISFPGGDIGYILESSANGRLGQTYILNGSPLGNFYGYKTDGVFIDQQAVDAYVNENGRPVQPYAQPGDIRYVDVNGDGAITPDDRTIIGNAMPDFIMGFSNRISWRQLELSAFIYVQSGNDVFNITRYYLEGMHGDRNQTSAALNRWVSESEPGDGKTPRATKTDPNHNWRLWSDRWIEDASFIRLRNITLSYNLPGTITEKLNIGSCRLSLTGQNLMTLTRYSGFDPEVSSNAQSAYFHGYDLGAYPSARSILFTINLAL